MANEEQKTRVIHIRLSEAEIVALDKAAIANGMSRSAYLRLLIENVGVNSDDARAVKKKIILDTQTARELWRELNKQGVNLNQIARQLNSIKDDDYYDERRMERIEKRVDEIESHIAGIEKAYLVYLGEKL